MTSPPRLLELFLLKEKSSTCFEYCNLLSCDTHIHLIHVFENNRGGHRRFFVAANSVRNFTYHVMPRRMELLSLSDDDLLVFPIPRIQQKRLNRFADDDKMRIGWQRMDPLHLGIFTHADHDHVKRLVDRSTSSAYHETDVHRGRL